MTERHIPLPPPENHLSGCTCQVCFPIRLEGEAYSLRVLTHVAEFSIAALGPTLEEAARA